MRNPKITITTCCIALLLALTTPVYGESVFSQEEITQTCELSSLDKPIKPVRQEKPRLPTELQDVKASVQVAFIIDAYGHVTNPRIVRCTNDSFRNIALENARSWEFEPGTKGGKPVSIRVIVPIRFNSSTH
jgi:TonB family protein